MENIKSKKNVVIIDGYGLIFRAFFSLKDFKTKEGLPIGAVYGFINMLLKLYSTLKTDYSILVFDSGKKTFRSEIYPEYKANRQKTPEDLKPQFAIVREAADAMNIKYVEVPGFEADDIIATYSKLCLERGFYTTIVTSDKDLMQLIQNDITCLFDPMKSKFLTEKDVEARFLIKPDRMSDFLAIVGDISDNIPGVPGIGVKGAAVLLSKYRNLEEIYENIEKIGNPKVQSSLLKHKELAFLSKQLTSLKFDVNLEDVECFKKNSHEGPKFIEFLKKYSLNSYFKTPSVSTMQAELF